MEHNLSFHEIIPDQTLPDCWKEISLNTGGTQSTLQDIKVTERASGYAYKDSNKFFTRNRFIYWHINNDILELVEQSLDINLFGNNIKYKFVDTPILDGVSAYESEETVVILVPTVCSIHKLTFPHPSQLHKQDELIGSHPDLSVSSIFSEANSLQPRDPSTFYVFSHPTAHSQLPHLAASILINNDALFLLAYPTNEVILIRQYENGECETVELKTESIVPRFLADIADKFRAKPTDNNVVSMILHNYENATFAVILTNDGYLRVWNCSKAICISDSEVLLEANNKYIIQGAQNFMLKKAVEIEDEILFAVYVKSNTESRLFIVELIFDDCEHATFKMVTYLIPPYNDLVDFSFNCTQIWTMWRGKERESEVYSAKISTSINNGIHWMPAVLEQTPNLQEVPYNCEYIGPKEAYLNYIFYPGRFPLYVINKALNIYKRSSIHSELNVSATILKQRVCMAVENEIHAILQESEVNDEDYLECANECWRAFYSCCIQYYVTGLRPLGVLLLPSVSGIVLLKRKMYSFLRPLDFVEHLILCTDYISNNHLIELEDIFNSKTEVEDVVKFVNIITYMDDQLNDLYKIMFEEEMEHGIPPENIVEQLLTEVELSEVFTISMQTNINGIKDLRKAFENVLKMLNLEFCENADEMQIEKSNIITNQLFNSQLGISFVSETFKQQAFYRYSLCRKLLTFAQVFLLKHSYDVTYEFIESFCMPEIINLMRSYFVMYWFSKQSALPILPLEATMQRLSPLKFSPVFNLRINNMQTLSLMELFAGSSGGFAAHKTLFNERTVLPEWHVSLLQYLIHLRKLMWPQLGSMLLAEWLVTSGQHLWLQHYVHLMKDWCDVNMHSRNFLLATAFLTSGEHYKAYDLFVNTALGVQEDYIFNKTQQRSMQDYNPIIMYYLKIIHLFELHGARDYALDLANAALAMVITDEPLTATLYSIKFKHHLALGHYEAAYEALCANPDDDRKKDNLRDLVKTLLDNKELNILMNLNYTTMDTLFCNILFTRARACDTIDNMFYDCLFSYQVKRGIPHMRQAGAVMYEQAFRLRHHNTIEALEKQVKCYMAAINCLSLCDPRFAWVLIPADPELPEEVITLPPEAGTDDEFEELSLKHKVDVVELKTIRLELSLVSARLKLAKFDPTYLTNFFAAPGEIVMYLTTVGLLKTALSICRDFELPYDPVFEMLTRQCILLTESEDLDAWNWLTENNLHELPTVGNNPSTIAWLMLKTFLDECEQDDMSALHKIVSQKIIQMGGYIPQWLLISYKKRNPAELLRLYLFNGRLLEAHDLAKDHLLAALGYGPDHFNIDCGVAPTTQPFCLPVNIIDALIYELHLQNEHNTPPLFENEYQELKELFLKYLETTARISNQRSHIDR